MFINLEPGHAVVNNMDNGSTSYKWVKDTSSTVPNPNNTCWLNPYDTWWIDPYYPGPYYPGPYYPYEWVPPAPNYPGRTGWVCPKCGAANAPHISQCPCNATPYRITWSSDTTNTISVKGSNS